MNISLILPCYNEETNIQKGVLDRIGNFVKEHPTFSEILIVDDGSTDSTKEIIKKDYLPKFKQMRLIENVHGGKAYAVIEGIKNIVYEYPGFRTDQLGLSFKLINQFRGNVTSFGVANGTRTRGLRCHRAAL